MEAARAAGVPRVVYAASSSCYGIPDHCPISEDAPIRHEYPYGLTKYLGEQIVLHWAKAYAMSNVSLRLFNVFGPRMNEAGGYGSVLAVFLAQRRRSQPLTITGDGSQSRDFTYATDVARAFILAAQSRSSGEAFNIGTGKPQTVNRLAEVVGGPVVYVPKRVREPESHFADATKAQKFLGWRPEVTFEEGIERVLSLAGSASS
jgi:UDP-glucose 4-epimerase